MSKGGNMKTVTLNNNVLVEVMRDDDGVSRTDDNESMKFGRLIGYRVDKYHLTASAAVRLDDEYVKNKDLELMSMIGSIVRWEEYAEGGQTFEQDGKTLASIPWWRLITTDEEAE
jgi:hypothetical protein